MLHHVTCLEEELAFIDVLAGELFDKLRYARGRTRRLRNRLRSELR
jgi:hypothetical protein